MSGLILPRRGLWTPFARVRDDTGKRMRLDTGERLNDADPACCCGDSEVSCSSCSGSAAPNTFRVTISGLTSTGGVCDATENCAAWNGVYIVEFVNDISSTCTWNLDIASPTAYCEWSSPSITYYTQRVSLIIGSAGLIRVRLQQSTTPGGGSNPDIDFTGTRTTSDCNSIDQTLTVDGGSPPSSDCNASGTARVESL